MESSRSGLEPVLRLFDCGRMKVEAAKVDSQEASQRRLFLSLRIPGRRGTGSSSGCNDTATVKIIGVRSSRTSVHLQVSHAKMTN